MVGLIVNAFVDYVNNYCSEAGKEALRRKTAGLTIMATENYPDELVVSVIEEVAKAENKSLSDILKEFGRSFIKWSEPKFRMAYSAPTAKEFLLKMALVHKSAKSYSSQAVPPAFQYEDPSADKLVMLYNSNRKLCPLIHGLIKGVGERYGCAITVEEKTCMHKGASECRFEITFG